MCPPLCPGTWAGAGGRPGPSWKHARAHVCTLLSNTHAHTGYIPLCTCSPHTHIHTDTVIHRQHRACTPRCTTIHRHTQPHLCAHLAYTYPYLHTAHSLHVHIHTPKHTDTLKHEYIHVQSHIFAHSRISIHTFIIHVHMTYATHMSNTQAGMHINRATCTYLNAHLNTGIYVTATYANMTKHAHTCVHIKPICKPLVHKMLI